jgi:hypothetical protein
MLGVTRSNLFQKNISPTHLPPGESTCEKAALAYRVVNVSQVEDVSQIDARLPGKGNSNSHGARPVHLIITMIKWIRTSRLPIKKSL